MLVVYLSNRYIRAVKGSYSGKKFRIRDLWEITDRKGCILNGNITDRETFTELIRAFWWDNKLPKKDVHLVIDSSRFTTKTIEVPVMKPDRMLGFVAREFAEVDRIPDPVYGYFTLPQDKDNKKKKTANVYGMMASREHICGYLDIFKGLGITVESVQSVMGAMIRLTGALTELKNFTGILQFVDDITIINTLLVNGKIVYNGRNRIYADFGTPQYPVEAARAVSTVLQFARAQGIEEDLKTVLISGLGSVDFSIYSDSIMQIDDQITAKELTTGLDAVYKKKNSEMENALTSQGMMLAIGALIRIDTATNAAKEAVRNPEREEKSRKIRKAVIPLATAAAVMGGSIAGLSVMLAWQSSALNKVTQFNQDPLILYAADRYDKAVEMTGMYGKLENQMSELESGLKQYPLVDGDTEWIVAGCADGLVNAAISSYNSQTGVLTFQTNAEEVSQIHEFAALLGQKKIFSKVNYTGYVKDTGGQWNVRVNCTMAEREEAEDE